MCYVLLQVALERKKQSLETQDTDGLEPRRAAPMPDDTAFSGSETNDHRSASRKYRFSASGTAEFTAGLRAAMGQGGGFMQDADKEKAGIARRKTSYMTSATFGSGTKNVSSQVQRLFLSLTQIRI